MPTDFSSTAYNNQQQNTLNIIVIYQCFYHGEMVEVGTG